MKKNQATKQNHQIELIHPFHYNIDRCQVKLEDNHEPPSETEDKPVRFSTHQSSDYHNKQEIENSPIRMPSGYGQTKANLKQGM